LLSITDTTGIAGKSTQSTQNEISVGSARAIKKTGEERGLKPPGLSSPPILSDLRRSEVSQQI
jgi:hypothetical protein